MEFFVVFVILVSLLAAIAVLGHGIWLLCAAIGKAIGLFPSAPRRTQDALRPDPRDAYLTALRELKNRGHLDEEEYRRLVSLGDRIYVPAPRSPLNAEEGRQLRPAPSVAAEATPPVSPPTPTPEPIFEAQLVDRETHRSAPPPELLSTPPAEVHPLDLPVESEVDVPQPVGVQARRQLGQVVASFLNKNNIRWGELIAGLLIVVCSIGLVISLWNTFQETNRMITAVLLMAGTAAIEGAGLYTLRRWRLRRTSRSVLVIASLLVPLNIVAAIALGSGAGNPLDLSSPLALSTIVISAAVYTSLMVPAGRALLGRDAWRWVVAVIGPSASLLAVPLSLQAMPKAAAVCLLLPIAALLASVVGGTDPLRSIATKGQLRRYLLLWATALFGTLVCLCFFVSQSELSRLQVNWIAIAAIPLLLFAALTSERLRVGLRVRAGAWLPIFTRSALFICGLGLAATLVIAWPTTMTGLAWSAVMLITCGLLMLRDRNPLLVHGGYAAVAVAAFAVSSQLAHPVGWDEWMTLSQRFLTPYAVATAGLLFALFATMDAIPIRGWKSDAGYAVRLRKLVRSGNWRDGRLCWTLAAAAGWTLLTSALLLVDGMILPLGWSATLLAMLCFQIACALLLAVLYPPLFHLAAALCLVGGVSLARGSVSWETVVRAESLSVVSHALLYGLAGVGILAMCVRFPWWREALGRVSSLWVVGLCGILIAVALAWVPSSLSTTVTLLAIVACALLVLALIDQNRSLVEASSWIGLAAVVLFAADQEFLQWSDREAWRAGRIAWQMAVIAGGYSFAWSLFLMLVRSFSPAPPEDGRDLPEMVRATAFAAAGSVWIAIGWILLQSLPALAGVLNSPEGFQFTSASIRMLPLALLGGSAAIAAAAARCVRRKRNPESLRWTWARTARHEPLVLLVVAGLSLPVTAAILAVPLWCIPLVIFFVAIVAGIAAQLILHNVRVSRSISTTDRTRAIQTAFAVAAAVAVPLLLLIVGAGIIRPLIDGRVVAASFWLGEAAIGCVALWLATTATLRSSLSLRQVARSLIVAGIVLANFSWSIREAFPLTPFQVAVEFLAGLAVGLWAVVGLELLIGWLRRFDLQRLANRVPEPLRLQRHAVDEPAPLPHWLSENPFGFGGVARSKGLGIVLSLAAAASLAVSAIAAAIVLVNVGAAPGPVALFVTPAVQIATAVVLIALAVKVFLDASRESRHARTSLYLAALQQPWLTGGLLVAAGPVAAWAAVASNYSPLAAWSALISVVVAASLLASVVTALTRTWFDAARVSQLHLLAWSLSAVTIALAIWGRAHVVVPDLHILILLAVGAGAAFTVAYACRDALLNEWASATAALFTAIAAAIAWEVIVAPANWNLVVVGECALSIACLLAVESLLWRYRCLAGRIDIPPVSFRGDSRLFSLASTIGIVTLLLMHWDSGATGIWFDALAGPWPWCFALLTIVGSFTAFLRSDHFGQTIVGTLSLGIVVALVAATTLLWQRQLEYALALPITGLFVGLLAIGIAWRSSDIARVRSHVPRFQALPPVDQAGLQRQFVQEFAAILVLVSPLIAVAAFVHVLVDPSSHAGWISITSLIAWGIAVAAAAEHHSTRWLRTESVLLIILAVYAGALTNLPSQLQAALLIGAIHVLVASLAMVAILTYLPRLWLGGQLERWAASLRTGVGAVTAGAVGSTGLVLALEFNFRSAAGIPAMETAIVLVPAVMIGGIAAALFAIALRGRVGGLFPAELSLAVRQGCVYGAQLVALLGVWHVFLCRPGWIDLGLREAWPWIAMGIAFAATGMAALAERWKSRVLTGPLANNALLIPVVGVWLSASDANLLRISALPEVGILLLATVHYGFLATIERRGTLAKVLSIVSANAAVWIWLASQPGWGVLAHPQAWIIPPAACVLIAIHLERDRLPGTLVTAARYVGTLLIYVASTADMLIQQIGSTIAGPMILIILSLLGMGLGVVLRVRPFLYLGSLFLLVSLTSMVWYAQRAIDEVWPWWAFGISMGIALLIGLTLMERHRGSVQRLAQRLQHWDG